MPAYVRDHNTPPSSHRKVRTLRHNCADAEYMFAPTSTSGHCLINQLLTGTTVAEKRAAMRTNSGFCGQNSAYFSLRRLKPCVITR